MFQLVGGSAVFPMVASMVGMQEEYRYDICVTTIHFPFAKQKFKNADVHIITVHRLIHLWNYTSSSFTMSTDNDETKLYTDLKGFLMSDRLDLRRAATEAVLQVTDDENQSKLIEHGLVPLIGRHLPSLDAIVSVNALKALLQLSSSESTPLAKATSMQCVEQLLHAGGLDRLMEILLTTAAASSTSTNTLWRERVNLAMSLLANMTRSEEGSIALCGRMLPDEAVVANHVKGKNNTESSNDNNSDIHIPPKPTLELLLARFLNPQYIETDNDTDYNALLQNEDPSVLNGHTGDIYQHFAFVLMNATQVEQGRRFVLQLQYAPDSRKADAPPPTSNFQRLLPFLRHVNPIRRRGIAGLIRNCCSDKDSSFWFLTQVNLVDEHLLYPLAGPEELDEADKQYLNPDLWLQGYSKQREPDHYTRLFLVQALLLLCQSGRMARREMNRVKTSVVLKWANMVEEEDDVSEVMEQCLEYLKRDLDVEDGNDEISNRIEMLDDDYVDAEEKDALDTTAARPVRGATHVTQEDFDNVD
jgi:hypothetical protein